MQKKLYDLTNPQKLIWFTEEFYKGSPIENITGTVIISEKVNFALLEKAINKFVEKNDSFRLKFVIQNQKVQQYVDSYTEFPVEIVDVPSDVDLKNLEKHISTTVFNVLDSFLYVYKMVRFPDGHGGFIINMHHLISDAWSAGLGGSEIINIYTRLLKNESIEDINYPSYVDYINSEQSYIKSDKFYKDKAFWNNAFETIPETASIPSSTSIEQKDFMANSQRKQFTLCKNFINIISEFCKTSKFSIFNFFMSVFSIYIGRVSALDEFVIGTPILNRSNIKDKRTSGMFINTVPVKISLKDDIKFVDLASSLSSNLFNIFKHQKYSYLSLLEDLRHKDNKIPNLYNFLMSYQNIRSTAQSSETPFDIQWVPNEYISEDIDIHIYDMNDTGNINIAYDYKTSKYNEQDIIEIHERILNIINQILENNEILIKDLEIVTPEEKTELLHKYDNMLADYPTDKTVHQIFEEQVEKTPDNIAVVFEDKKLTYKELNEKANSLAHYLRDIGVNRNDIVALRVDKSIEMIVSILAIMKAGGCYLPINLSYPQDRVSFMLSDSKAKFLLCDEKTSNDIDVDIQNIFIDLKNTEIYSKNTANPTPINTPTDLIYIIYTSGSTGTPKGAMLMHKNVVRLMKNDKFLFDFDDKDAWTMFHSVSFDFSVWEMYGALLYGGKLVVVSDYVAKDPNLFLQLMDKENVTVLNQTPTYFYNLLNCEVKNPHPNLKIRYIIFGGEALKPTLIIDWHRLHPKTKLINMYGITETTVHVTFKELSATDLQSAVSNIGVPIPTLKILLLDKNLKLVPPGVPGEICVCGDGVFKGYLNRPDLNKLKLTPNPYNHNEIMYRSADSAFINADNVLEYIGRIDTQVKIRGFRVELGEIEEKILNFPGIKSCIVITQKNNTMHDLLYAYFISDEDIDINKLRNSLQKDLPAYMIPQHFLRLSKWPYNSNGKIDKKALPLAEANETKRFVAPRNDFDLQVVNIIKKLFCCKEISLTDSFFELGGDSLTAINLCALIQEKFNIQLFVKDILENPIISDLADIISDRINTSSDIVIKPAKKQDFYPLSSAQKRIYLASSMSGENSILYNIPGGIILDKMPDLQKLENCFKSLIERHEALRSYFEVVENDIVQKVHDSIDFKLEVPKKAISYENLNKTFIDFVKPFDLSKAPLFRTELIKLDNEKIALFLDMHHIISDGTSLAIFIDELCKLYNDQTLDKINISYKDFAVWENDKLNSGALKTAEDFWVNQFNDELPVLNLPTNYPRPDVQSFEGDRIHFNINPEITSKIHSISKTLGVTPYMLLLSTYYILLKKYASQDDIIIGSPVVGRDIADIYNTIGMFVNTLPLRATVNSKLSAKEFIEAVKIMCLDSFKYQTYPFDNLISKLNIPRNASRNPLFDTMFIYQNNGLRDVKLNNIDVEYYIPDINISKFDLSLEIIPKNNYLDLSFEYATKLFKKSFIENMSRHYCNILNSILGNINIKIADIDMLSKEEKHTILHDFNNTFVDFHNDKTITELFEIQANKVPDNIAIIFENQELSYKELNAKANSLAHYLRKNGINTESTVGIMLNRSLEMIISILAVLKAGGTYILIDNALPNNRVKYMLNDSNSTLLIIDNNYNIDFDNQLNIDDFDYSKNTSNLKCNKQLSDSFAIIYTSGSTGNPKGVLLQQNGLINLVYSFDKLMKIGSFSNHLGISSVSFDMFAVELYSSILLGRTLYLLNDEEMKNPILISNIIKNNHIEFLITTPTKMELLLSTPETAKCLRCLKGFQLGGEVFSPELYEKLSNHTNAKIYNGYGPTEITACCSNKYLTSKDDINIGKPIPNTEIYILDNDMHICPVDVPGELCVSGAGVSLGYINDKTKTSKTFVNTKFTDKIVYRTKDIAKFNSNGELEYIGRNDFQVKLNGLRIELSEIEKKFIAIKEIENCIVLCDKSKTFLKAFFTANESLSIPAIRKKLSEVLPTYMVPKYIIQIENIPMTLNGKIDRKALDELKTYTSEESLNYVEPTNDIQKLFCNIWEKILQTQVGIDNDLFELGADSLSAIRFKVEALNNNIDIPYSDIFKYKTIRKLSESKTEENITTPIESFDYTEVNKILRKNNKKQLKYSVEKSTNNNVVLLGCNGFVGMHIINSFITNDTGTIYCVMRDKNGKGALNRFLDVLHFYFGTSLDKYIGNRIIVLKGDIIKENFGLSSKNYEVIINNTDTIINAAANVKHFGNFDKFKNINIDATSYTIDFCKKYSKRLLHLSTLSISGNMFLDGSISRDTLTQKTKVYFSESDLFINQSLDNVYTRSKFEAEKIILDNISTGLDAQILRLGNITSRSSDGKFQINPDSNAFTNRLKSFVLLGVVPKSLLKQEIEFTAVDECSDAIIKILQNKNKNISVLHLYNSNHTNGDKLFKAFKSLGISIKAIDDKDFASFITDTLSDQSAKGSITGIVNDLDLDKKLSYSSNTYIKSDFSINFLLRSKFKWRKIDKEYLIKYICYLKNINYFN